MRHYYRLVYWKRRLLGTGRPGGAQRLSYGHGSRAGERRARALRIRQRTRPVLVFAVIVGIVLAVSALFGGLGSVGGVR